MDNTETKDGDYNSLSSRELIEWLGNALDAIDRAHDLPQVSDRDKFYLDVAHDVVKANRNNLIATLPKEEDKAVIVTATKGATVRAVSGISDCIPLRKV